MTTYIAYGYDHELSAPPGYDYWIAGWGEDGPTTPEVYATSITEALEIANDLARELGVEACEVDEHGPVRLSPERRFRLYSRLADVFGKAGMKEAEEESMRQATEAARESPVVRRTLLDLLERIEEGNEEES